jgi:hypothetical protein
MNAFFRDLSQFYTPKCYDASGNFEETNDMKQFILRTLRSMFLMRWNYTRITTQKEHLQRS